ncbi:MAG TPA: PLP-dependent aminotransferase family protein [Acidobacteriaceae bacterium]|nr:PLP-dependent aminotransferase family protein [Acidobacteriaceae bacterium]
MKVAEAIAPVISVDRKASDPLHKQIYDGFRTAIIRGNLRPGQRVPSSRALAVELSLSRIPVLNAYAQLLAEGYFETRKGSGTFISEALPESLTICNEKAPQRSAASGLRPVARRSLREPYERPLWSGGWGAFGVHQPAFERFPFAVWSSLIARHSRSPMVSAIHNIDPLGTLTFREAICDYLRTARAVRCEPHQVMIVSGSQQALELSARVLLERENAIWFEDPGYRLARRVFTGAGCRVVPVPVDQDGMIVSTAIERCPRARAAYVTPSHQYPLGSTMSAGRRMQLLNWAERAGSWIIEDDYDSEYRFESAPIASLQGLDRNARVIYIGTFSKVLFPSLRLGYIVIPEDLVDHFAAARLAMDIFPPYLYQEVITDFMREGHFARHIRKMRLLYSERRTALVENLREQIGPALQVHGSQAGMHLAVTLPKGFRDQDIALRAATKGLWLWPLSPSYIEKPPRQGLVLGFGNTPTEEMSAAVSQLRTHLRK